MQELRNISETGYVTSLKGFDELKCIYIHIPKTGGVSINQRLFNNLGSSHMTIKGCSLIFSKLEFDSYYKFSVVRNPFDRLASAYFFLKESGFHEKDQQWFSENLSKYNTFQDFVINWVNKKNVYSSIHFIPQYEFVCINDKLSIDEVFKLEEIDAAYKKIARKLNIKDMTLSKLNAGKNKIDYMELYDKKSLAIVENIYKKDFVIFDY